MASLCVTKNNKTRSHMEMIYIHRQEKFLTMYNTSVLRRLFGKTVNILSLEMTGVTFKGYFKHLMNSWLL